MQTYFAINASAGSGKTYNLVQKLLMICLQTPDKSDGISHILALTFTNKAANEMKARILGWLEDFTKDNFKENNELIGVFLTRGESALTKKRIQSDDRVNPL